MLTAIIDQAICVKCTICIDACPFDAIVGSIGEQHNVLADVCVGCKLCIEPCPVDCIEMVPLASLNSTFNKQQIVANAKRNKAAKIARINLQERAQLSSKDTIKQDLVKIKNNK